MAAMDTGQPGAEKEVNGLGSWSHTGRFCPLSAIDFLGHFLSPDHLMRMSEILTSREKTSSN